MPLTKPRVALLAFVLSLLMLGSASLYVYWVVQRQLSLEGRNLCSTSALRVDVTPATAVRLVHEVGGDARAFVDLDDFGIVRAFVAAHPESFDYPASARQPDEATGGPFRSGGKQGGRHDDWREPVRPLWI